MYIVITIEITTKTQNQITLQTLIITLRQTVIRLDISDDSVVEDGGLKIRQSR